MANILKKAVSGLFEKMLSSSRVIDVRAWQPATMYEIDVHLPTMNLEKWKTIHRLKCKVDQTEFRDYTPASWNAATKVCTMYIEAGHNGAGSRWIQQLKTGDEILLGGVHAAQLPAKEGKILCLGDGSALGHFLALKQLTDREQYPMEVAVHMYDDYQIPTSFMESNPEFELISEPHGNNLEMLEKWFMSKDLSNYTSVYIAGNIPLVSGLRKKLKAAQGMQARIYAHGFWS